jgi:hypothetical protein
MVEVDGDDVGERGFVDVRAGVIGTVEDERDERERVAEAHGDVGLDELPFGFAIPGGGFLLLPDFDEVGPRGIFDFGFWNFDWGSAFARHRRGKRGGF